jgi:hypothetical protein
MLQTTQATQTTQAGSMQKIARIAGVLYLIVIVLGLLGEGLVRNSLIVAGDPAATAHNILAAEFTWRLGVAGQYLLLVCAVGLTWTWYVLLRPVNRNLTLLAIFFALISLAVESVSALHLQAVMAPLTGSAFVQIADPRLAYAMAYLSVVAHANAFGLALVFFGVECLIVGHLVRRSGYLPKFIGILMQVAGACYLINSLSMVLLPSLQGKLFPAILLPCLVGEGAFCLWLLIKGVDVQKIGG